MLFNLYGRVHNFVFGPYLASDLTSTQVPMYLLLDEGTVLPWLSIVCGTKWDTPDFFGESEHAPPVWSTMGYRL